MTDLSIPQNGHHSKVFWVRQVNGGLTYDKSVLDDLSNDNMHKTF